MTLDDIVVGNKYLDAPSGEEVVAIFSDVFHSVTRYNGYVLVQYIKSGKGWFADPEEELVPKGEFGIHGLGNLLWILPERLLPPLFDDIDDGYEVD